MRLIPSRLSLSQKISLSLALVLLALSLPGGTYLISTVRAAFAEQEQELGSLLPKVLASALSNPIASGQKAAVQELVDDAARGDTLAYVMVLGAQGELLALAGPYAEEVGARLDAIPPNRSAGTLTLGQAEVLDLHAAVSGGSAGHVHVGLGLGTVRTRSAAVGQRSVLLILGSILFIVLAAALVSRRFTAPLQNLTRVVNRIAEEGDLTTEVPVVQGEEDEVAQLARAFAAMVARLKEVLLQLHESSELLSEAVLALEESAQQQNEMVTRHATALQQTQITAQHIRQMSQLAAGSAEDVLRVAQRAEELGRTGEDALAQTVEGLVELRSHVVQIAEKIAALGDRTEQIGGITETVKDLADQSNLLAINAAIEAARGGEEGRGFEVVAREIRTLADQSIRSTSQVREILVDIAGAISATVRITDQGTRRMEAGLAQVRTSGENLRELSAIVRDSAASVRQIAHIVNQQHTGISQIFNSVTDLGTLMEDTVKRIEATSASTATLKLLSERVSEVLRPYRV